MSNSVMYRLPVLFFQILQFATVAQTAPLVESGTPVPQSGAAKIVPYFTLALGGLLPAILLS